MEKLKLFELFMIYINEVIQKGTKMIIRFSFFFRDVYMELVYLSLTLIPNFTTQVDFTHLLITNYYSLLLLEGWSFVVN